MTVVMVEIAHRRFQSLLRLSFERCNRDMRHPNTNQMMFVYLLPSNGFHNILMKCKERLSYDRCQKNIGWGT
ncbi:hypothetical protein L288_17645 [Sphingobium quisquiliarum P25]|uniref:Uncharacterized protein n=1 Tax=Sphingobium quisquiliarum P25 TaxID=1329909 RepID=T0GLS5_9SPHN|nr:hypothetical protein L288_17645 [Sphingobium quisquiliarum P25]